MYVWLGASPSLSLGWLWQLTSSDVSNLVLSTEFQLLTLKPISALTESDGSSALWWRTAVPGAHLWVGSLPWDKERPWGHGGPHLRDPGLPREDYDGVLRLGVAAFHHRHSRHCQCSSATSPVDIVLAVGPSHPNNQFDFDFCQLHYIFQVSMKLREKLNIRT